MRLGFTGSILPLPGEFTKKSKRISSPVEATWARRNPPPPRLARIGSATVAAKPAARAASKALPPFFNTSQAASVVRVCPVDTAPLIYRIPP
ncbi:hypothetical protein BMS3Bbin06_01146 [bacterium BMS3Bbin06]|nr:hypothetical protein BMS3Bbin06_01146 [bacterium BMS3Bbin06]